MNRASIETCKYFFREWRIVIIGNPDNRRVHYFLEALGVFDAQQVAMLSYEDLLFGKEELSTFLGPKTIVRFESPGESFAVEKGLLMLGAKAMEEPQANYDFVEGMEKEFGRVRYMKQWYRGYRALLEECAEKIDRCEGVVCFTHPNEIISMFDKFDTKRRLTEGNVTTPQSLGEFSCYDEFFSAIKEEELVHAFIKPKFGSSASGVLAYSYSREKGERIITSLDMKHGQEETRFYNSLRLRMYQSKENVREVVDFLVEQDCLFEEWVPKHRAQGGVYDLRMVAIEGEVGHSVMRLSRSPMTNLHLGNRRGDVVALEESLGPEVFSVAKQEAVKGLSLFPQASYAGVDVMLHKESLKPYIIEMNAFGDLLPNVLYEDMDTYTYEVYLFLNRLYAEEA